MLCISPTGRITRGCAGIWSDEQVGAWKHIVDFVHANSKAKFCAQIGHSGRKGATCVPWQGGIDEPLGEGAWEIVAPSAIPYLPHSAVPREMTEADMAEITEQFVAAARNADRAGFDMIEVHLAHGYLLSSFISPVTNRRDDAYGGDIEARMKFPLYVLAEMRKAWPADKPVSARVSATDWVNEGLSEADRLAVASMLRDAGVDIINVSTGQVTRDEEPVYGRMYQAPFSDQIRNEVGIPTIVAGNVTTADQANTLVAAGRTDIVAFGRAMMNEPHFVLSAAAHYGHGDQHWAPQYLSGKFMAESQADKENAEMLELRRAAKPPNPGEALAIAIARGEVLQKSEDKQ
jgi:anthraniloyl-CoA monooxygenase